jgi:hypothetical protein
MRIFAQFVQLGGLLTEGVILVRSIQGKSFARYSLFYTYVASVLVISTFLYVISIARPSLNVAFYWPAQFITLALGCGVIFEISRHVFAQHVSLNRFVRWIMAMTFGMIFLLVAIHAFLLPGWNPAVNTADLERDLRLAEAVALLTIVLLTQYYGIEIGKNMKGMILGFGVYVGASVISLTLRLFVGIRFDPAWTIIQPSSYVAALLIWAVALWSYEPAPAMPPAPTDADYQRLAGRTRQVLGSIQEHLDRTPER